MGKPATFSIIGGGGFRAQFYLRIAEALPEQFRVSGLVVRDPGRAQAMERRWNTAVYPTMDELLRKERPDFVVVSVSKNDAPKVLLQLAERSIPALTETPPAPDLEGLLELHEKLTLRGAKVQVAEQYPLQPLHMARAEIIRSGWLGSVTQATVSISHFYHGMALMRRMLGIRFEEAKIRAMRFAAPITAGPDRKGPPAEEKIVAVARDLAWIDFGGKLGIYDFTKDQHRSWIRSNHLSVRGDRGELFDRSLKMLADYRTPLQLELKRINRGEEENLEGYFLQGIVAGERWVYTNPFAPARLFDDELAIAACLQKMADYAAGGPDFYGLPEASQDHYLGLMIERAILSGETVQTVRQPWAE
jgi:hypothetical protein